MRKYYVYIMQAIDKEKWKKEERVVGIAYVDIVVVIIIMVAVLK